MRNELVKATRERDWWKERMTRVRTGMAIYAGLILVPIFLFVYVSSGATQLQTALRATQSELSDVRLLLQGSGSPNLTCLGFEAEWLTAPTPWEMSDLAARRVIVSSCGSRARLPLPPRRPQSHALAMSLLPPRTGRSPEGRRRSSAGATRASRP